jgi:hypothetical protein
MTETASISRSLPQPHYYLWHLIAMGVINAEFPNFDDEQVDLAGPLITGTAWDRIKAHNPLMQTSARIALIDVGVGSTHPNLIGRIDTELSIDLVTHPYGAKSMMRTEDEAEPCQIKDSSSFEPEQTAAFFSGLSIAELGPLGLSAAENTFLASLVDELAGSQGVVRTLINNDDVFGTHGTAIAGLAVGEPQITGAGAPADIEDILSGGDELAPGSNIDLIPYFGVDPLSRLISIRSSFEQNAEHFITAFLYAWSTGADIILLPRGIPDPLRGSLQPKPELSEDLDDRRNWERADLFARLQEGATSGAELKPLAVGRTADRSIGWDVLAKLILLISKHIPIICAAGNDGESQLIYPANLAASDNGIIAVGAVSSSSRRSGYSNYGLGLTLVAPSDDSEVYNRHQLRIDRTNPLVGQHAYIPGSAAVVPFGEFSLLTTDLPGTFGYSPGEEPYSLLQPLENSEGFRGGYYTSFGGTSGASALIGGAAALIARAYKVKHNDEAAKINGPALKQILVAACDPDAEVTPGSGPLSPDPMNSSNEAAKGKAYFFGAGLLNVSSAVEAILSS